MEVDDHEGLAALVARTTERAVADFAEGQVPADRLRTAVFVRARYQNQEFGVEVALPAGRPDAAMMQRMVADFHEVYEREYTYRLAAGVEIIGIHLVATAAVGKLELAAPPRSGAGVEDAVKGRRAVDYATEGVHEATIYDGTRLEPGMGFAGPAIVEDPGTTIVIHPGNRATIDDFGNTHIDIRG
jgi:N-methylhydantoinase A